MINPSALVCETIASSKPKPQHIEPSLSAEKSSLRNHGSWRDDLVRDLYSDTGSPQVLYTNLVPSPGIAWAGEIERGKAMALNLDSVRVTDTKLEKAHRGRDKRDLGPVLEWVRDSHDNKAAKRVAVKGVRETYWTKPRKGADGVTPPPEQAEKVTGDAGELTSLLRAAAAELNFGISIQYDTQKDDPNKVTAVRFLATQKQNRKSRSDSKPAA